MERGNVLTEIRRKQKLYRKNKKHEGDDLKEIKDLQFLIDKLKINEELYRKINRLMNTNNFAQIKNFDVIKILRGTQYSTKIDNFFEFDRII